MPRNSRRTFDDWITGRGIAGARRLPSYGSLLKFRRSECENGEPVAGLENHPARLGGNRYSSARYYDAPDFEMGRAAFCSGWCCCS